MLEFSDINVYDGDVALTFFVRATTAVINVRRCSHHGCQMAIAGFLKSYTFGPLGFWTMALLRYTAKFDFLSLNCAPCPPPWRNPRKERGQILLSGNLGSHRSPSSFLPVIWQIMDGRRIVQFSLSPDNESRRCRRSVWINMSSLMGEKGGNMTSSSPFFQRQQTRAGQKRYREGMHSRKYNLCNSNQLEMFL